MRRKEPDGTLAVVVSTIGSVMDSVSADAADVAYSGMSHVAFTIPTTLHVEYRWRKRAKKTDWRQRRFA